MKQTIISTKSVLFAAFLMIAFWAHSQSTHAHQHCSTFSKPLYEDMNTQIGPPADYVPNGVRSANFSVTYNGFTPQAQAAFQYAVDIWASQLTSSVTIRVDATWENLGAGTLGAAGAYTFLTDFFGAPQSNTFYPIALANKFAGFDLDSSAPDIVASFNSTTNWYFGTDGNCPSNQFDFVTVVLHELGHGLGIQGSGEYNGGQGSIGVGFQNNPIIYDRFTETGAGTDIDAFTSPSTNLGNALTGNDLFWFGSNGVMNNGNTRPKIYAPSSFNPGSSYSHLDESIYPAGNQNSLMTPFVGQAEAIHSPGPVMLGILEDLGWTIDNGSSGGCPPESITLFDGGCADDGYGNLLPTIGMVFNISGLCSAEDLCWGVNGAVPTCVNLPYAGFTLFDSDTLFLTNTDLNSTYEIYFTTSDGTSSSAFFLTGDCSGSILGCTNPFASNYNPLAEVDDDSCVYSYSICDCNGVSHTAGVQTWIGDNFADDNSFEWEGQLVDFNCETWAYDCGDIAGAPSIDPWNVCGGGLPPNNGCATGGCTPSALTLFDGGCADDGYGNILPAIGMIYNVNGLCNVEDLCWGVNGAAPSCVNLPDAGFTLFDTDTLFLTNTDLNSTYEIYFTTDDGTSSSAFFSTGDCSSTVTGCTNPFASNYNPAADTDDGSCTYSYSICDCNEVSHTAGVLFWLGDGFADNSSFEWEGQLVDFNCETWGYDCGDIVGAPSLDPWSVCAGDLPPNNGCPQVGCTPNNITLFDNGCQDDGYGNILPVIGMVFDINGTCQVEDLCYGVNGSALTCDNLPYFGFNLFDGDTLNLINTGINSTYEIYFTTDDGASGSAFFTTGDCSGTINGCTNPFASNYNPAADVDDGSCTYNYSICDCNEVSHTAGVLTWIGDGFADDNSFEWDGQLVDFNCETWAYDCGDIPGTPSLDPWNVCGGDLPPNNGCNSGSCTPAGLTLFDGGCADDGYGNILPAIGMIYSVNGFCNVEDLCWGVNGTVPTCVNLPDAGFTMFDTDTLFLTNTDLNSTYEIYFTTDDGTSSSAFFNTGDCTGGVTGCTNPNACNYDPSATSDDGSCEFTSCAGCTNPNACNYDLTATIDDGSCEFVSCAGCTDPDACNFDPTATIDDGSCEFDCSGCTNPNACNYDETATIDDGSCEFVTCAGCTDPDACNFDADATIDDGSCEFDCSGCTDPLALNYDENALEDDGSCIYECDYPVIDYAPYCEDGESELFYIEMNISDLGNGAPYIVTNNVTNEVIDLNFNGSINFGPFANLDEVVVTVQSSTLNTCIITSPLITYDCALGVDELHRHGIQAYPNPFQDILTINLNEESKCQIELIDGLGQRVLILNEQQGIVDINTSGLSKGVYFILISNDRVNAISRMIKQ